MDSGPLSEKIELGQKLYIKGRTIIIISDCGSSEGG